MGTYFVDTNRTEILSFIRRFTLEEGLGGVSVKKVSRSVLKFCAPTSLDLRHPRYTWICKSEGQGSLVKLRLRPPILRFLGLVVSFTLLAASCYTLGILFIVRGLHAIEHDAFLFALTLAVLAFFLLWGLRYFHTKRRMLMLEGLFANRLKNWIPSVMQSPRFDIFHLGTEIFLAYVPLTFLIAGLLRATPVGVVLIAPSIAATMALIIADTTAIRSPWTAWRVMLLKWVNEWALLCFMIFLVFMIFSLFGTTVLFFSKYEWFEIPSVHELLREAFGPRLLGTLGEATSQGILENNAVIFQQVMTKYQVGGYGPILEFDIGWRIMVCGVIIFMLVMAKGFLDWIKTWLLIHPGTKPTLSPPSGLRRTSSRRVFDSLVMGLFLLSAAIGNILHFLLTIEILSVVFFDRATLSYSIAQALGWLEIDLVAASEGNTSRHAIGTALLVILALPTVVTVLAWISYFVGHTVEWFKGILAEPVDDEYLELLRELSSRVGIRTPYLHVMQHNEPYIVTTIPCFSGRSRISVGWSILKNLSKEELKAAFAHELSHIKYDTRAIRCTRLLSLLSLFSCNAFALLLDMERREVRADNAATEALGNSKVLARALVKASLAKICTPDAKRADLSSKWMKGPLKKLVALWSRIVNCVSFIGLLFRPETIMGYTHPQIQDRLVVLAKSKRTDLRYVTDNLAVMPEKTIQK